MDFEQGIVARLEQAATLAADRVYWVERPQDAEMPDITLHAISDPRLEHLKGDQGARFTRMQCDCRAETFAEARQLADQAIAALRGPVTIEDKKFGNARVEGPRDLPERQSEKTIHRRSVDFIIWHVGD